MKSDEDSFCVLRLLETSHRFEPCIEVTDVRLKPVRGGGNAGIDEVCEGMPACFPEAFQHIVMDGIETKDIHLNETFQMLPAQWECCRRRVQQETAVPMENPFLSVAGMIAESLQLQSGLDVSKQMNMATLHVGTVGFEHRGEPR